MKSESNSRFAQSNLFESTLTDPNTVTIEIPGRLPSWNEILGMEHWARDKFKKTLQASFLSALQRSASDFSTKTTSAKNTMSIAAATLVSYQATQLEKRKLRRAKKKLKAQKTSAC